VVEAAGRETPESRAALAALCEAYWYPLYVFVRRSGHKEEDARDLIQGFFARFLERDYLRDRSPTKGKFRSYLLAALKHFMANEYVRTRAEKRGGGQQILPLEFDLDDGERRYPSEPSTNLTAEHVFEQRWAIALLRRALARLRVQYDEVGKREWFDALEGFLPGGRYARRYKEAAERLDMPVEKVKGVIHRLRGHYREIGGLETNPGMAGPISRGLSVPGKPPRAVRTDISCDYLSDVLKSIVTNECGITRRAILDKCVGQKESRRFDLRTKE
jgi:RNA polymerase sigma-70 factor (ECF subfamily)